MIIIARVSLNDIIYFTGGKMIQTKVYENGLRLIHENNAKKVVATSFMFNVGSQNESDSELGYSHFIEHLVFKGTKKINSLEIMDKLTFLGADYNAFTSKTSTKFVFKCLAENFEKCFDIFSEILINAEFDEKELNCERQVVIEEMKRCDDDPSEIMYKKAMENHFAGLSFAHDELGTEEIIENVTREQLLEYKNKYYKPENCVISVVGDVDFVELDKIVTKYFSRFFDYKAEPNKVDFEPYEINISKQFDIVTRDDNQANVCVVIKSVTSTDKQKYIADLYTSILGNSQNSRLFKTIREKMGLVYTIYAFNEMTTKTGDLIIAFGTRPKNVKKAMNEIKNIINEFAENGASEDEFLRAKNWKKSCFSFGTETNSNLAEINGTLFNVFNEIFDMEKTYKKTQDVTLEEVNDFAKRIANEKVYNVVAVGKDLKLEDIEF